LIDKSNIMIVIEGLVEHALEQGWKPSRLVMGPELTGTLFRAPAGSGIRLTFAGQDVAVCRASVGGPWYELEYSALPNLHWMWLECKEGRASGTYGEEEVYVEKTRIGINCPHCLKSVAVWATKQDLGLIAGATDAERKSLLEGGSIPVAQADPAVVEELAFRGRLRLKIKAAYLEKADVLKQFVEFLETKKTMLVAQPIDLKVMPSDLGGCLAEFLESATGEL
jgi:hypothetical protein